MIILYTLPYCQYSISALELVKKLKVPYKNIIVKDKDKEKYKKKHNMQTFPQIFFKNKKGKLVKLGGYTEFYELVCNIRKKGKGCA